MNYWKVLWSWWVPANTSSEHSRIPAAACYSSEPGGLGPICPMSQACQDHFLFLLKSISLFHLCVTTECPSFQKQVFADTTIFVKTSQPTLMCFGTFGSDLCVAHQFCSKSFSVITSTCSSTSVQNAIVRHVRSHSHLPWHLCAN